MRLNAVPMHDWWTVRARRPHDPRLRLLLLRRQSAAAPDQQVFVTVWTTSVEKTGGYVISKLVLTGLSAASHIAFFYFINVNFWLMSPPAQG